MIKSKTSSTQKKKRQGFTLTELTIVVGILGLVLGGIWTAASTVYNNYNEQDLLKKFVFIANNLHVFNTMNVSDSSDVTISDSCGATPPCGSSMFIDAGVFPSDFIAPNSYTDGTIYGAGPNLYLTKYGYTLWTGVENAEVYDSQAGNCPPSGICAPAPTVVEIDLFNMPIAVCTKLLMDVLNAHIDQLYSISTGESGPDYNWGPAFVASKGGTPSIPDSMSLSDATRACSSNFAQTSSSSPSQLWVMFIVR